MSLTSTSLPVYHRRRTVRMLSVFGQGKIPLSNENEAIIDKLEYLRDLLVEANSMDSVGMC